MWTGCVGQPPRLPKRCKSHFPPTACHTDERDSQSLLIQSDDGRQPLAAPHLLTEICDSRPSRRGSRTGKMRDKAFMGRTADSQCFSSVSANTNAIHFEPEFMVRRIQNFSRNSLCARSEVG